VTKHDVEEGRRTPELQHYNGEKWTRIQVPFLKWTSRHYEPNRIKSVFLAIFSGLTKSKSLTLLNNFEINIDSSLTKLEVIG
jgi:hypothetical protein